MDTDSHKHRKKEEKTREILQFIRLLWNIAAKMGKRKGNYFNLRLIVWSLEK